MIYQTLLLAWLPVSFLWGVSFGRRLRVLPMGLSWLAAMLIFLICMNIIRSFTLELARLLP